MKDGSRPDQTYSNQSTAPTMVVTRPRAQAQTLIAALHRHGVPTLAFPLIDIAPAPDVAPLQRALAALESFRLVVFVSANAVNYTFAQRDRPWPMAVSIAVLGPGSARALASCGVTDTHSQIILPHVEPDSPPTFDSEALIRALATNGFDAIGLRGVPVLLIRGNGGREVLGRYFQDVGAHLTVVEAYQRLLPHPDAQHWAAVRQLLGRPHAWLLTSSEAVRNLILLAKQGLDPLEVSQLRQTVGFVPHARIAATAREAGFVNITLTGAGDEQLVDAVVNWVATVR